MRSPAPPPGAPDARFTLAAERTLLAWIRTALGFLAGGVAIVYVAPDVSDHDFETVLGLLMVALGCVIVILGTWRWRQTDKALRTGGAMPGSSQVLVVVTAIVVVAVAIAVAIVIQN
ncbi:YidH family protein [Gordonia sp. DT30]|uniref:YidH family protein n=1 Tax=unclassified Gordonia (in: high G+C Gram-positive bacteria) TaxID=2657482 RepID=UPI003CEB2795